MSNVVARSSLVANLSLIVIVSLAVIATATGCSEAPIDDATEGPELDGSAGPAEPADFEKGDQFCETSACPGGTLEGVSFLEKVAHNRYGPDHGLGASFEPALVDVPEAIRTQRSKVSPIALGYWLELLSDFADRPNDVLPSRWLRITSGYRSFCVQCGLFWDNVDIWGSTAVVDTFSARAGHSEHQLGTAFDLYAGRGRFLGGPYDVDPNGQGPAPADPALYEWLDLNAHRFGFINSYPPNDDDPLSSFPVGSRTHDITGYKVEPWHWRFVGRWASLVHHRLHELTGVRLSAHELTNLLDAVAAVPLASSAMSNALEQALDELEMTVASISAPHPEDEAAIIRGHEVPCRSATYDRYVRPGECVIVRHCEIWRCETSAADTEWWRPLDDLAACDQRIYRHRAASVCDELLPELPGIIPPPMIH